MSTAKRYIIPSIVCLVIIGIVYYVTIPPINIQSTDFWWFLIECVVVVGVVFGIPRAHEAGTNFFEDIQREGLGAFFDFKERRDEKRAARKAAKASRKAGAAGSGAGAAAGGTTGAGGDADASAGAGKASKRSHVKRGFLFYIVAIIVIILLILVVGNIASSAFFNARAYSGLVETQEGDFATDIGEIPMSSVPVVDKDTAIRLGSRTIGEMSDLVSQFGIDESYTSYTQINYKDAPYRVSSLTYADIIKWFFNTGSGLPGYITVNMATQETELVRLEEGHYMHISTGEHFNNYLYRYVRFQYPTTMFGTAAFELDDDGNPYWIVPTKTMRIGLFGGEDYDGAILVDACTGATQRYSIDEIPSWCDKVFNADMVYEQLGYYGKYQKGFWNSLIGQSGVLVPTGSSAPSLFSNDDDTNDSSSSTSGYNYLAIDNDVYMYTGMTSANSDESLVGFMLVNLRTKETRYYTCAGATETSAMRSAEGQVQQMNYDATSPLLLNIADRPTYFLSLKDSAGLVKMYAFIDVEQYQIVGTGSTVAEAQENYVTALANDDQVDVDTEELAESGALPSTSGTVEAIESVVVDGNTRYYIKLAGDDAIYVAGVSANENLPFIKSGDAVEITYTEGEGVREVSTLS